MTEEVPRLGPWLIGSRLRRLREAAKKTRRDVDAAQIASESKLSRIESGKQLAPADFIVAAGQLYDVDPQVVSGLLTLREAAGQPGWWEGADSPGWLAPVYLELEHLARLIQAWSPELVHGLLQTPAYARAVTEADERLEADEVDRRVELRLARQEMVLAHCSVDAVIGEGATKIQIGSQEVMDEQIRHLLAVARRPNISIHVLPWSAGAHPSMRGPFALLTLPGTTDPDVVYYESYVGAHYLEEPEFLREYRTVFQRLRERSLPLEEYVQP